jgi:hypothetical protein
MYYSSYFTITQIFNNITYKSCKRVPVWDIFNQKQKDVI